MRFQHVSATKNIHHDQKWECEHQEISGRIIRTSLPTVTDWPLAGSTPFASPVRHTWRGATWEALVELCGDQAGCRGAASCRWISHGFEEWGILVKKHRMIIGDWKIESSKTWWNFGGVRCTVFLDMYSHIRVATIFAWPGPTWLGSVLIGRGGLIAPIDPHFMGNSCNGVQSLNGRKMIVGSHLPMHIHIDSLGVSKPRGTTAFEKTWSQSFDLITC